MVTIITWRHGVQVLHNYVQVRAVRAFKCGGICNYRLPLFLFYPIKRRFIACGPLLGPIDLSPYLDGNIDHVTVNGESGREARECDYDWVLAIREQCVEADITFWFKSTGSFFKRDGVVQKVNPFKQSGLAKELNINILNGKKLF